MRFNLAKEITVSLLIVVIALITILSGQRLNVPSRISVEGFNVQAYEYSISFNHDRNPSNFYKISPYDDALYVKNANNEGELEKAAFADEKITNLFLVRGKQWRFENIWYRLQTILGNPLVRFESEGRYQVVYEASVNDQVIVIEKEVRGVQKPIIGYIHALGFSNEDVVFDSNGTAFTRTNDQELLSLLKLSADTSVETSRETVQELAYVAIYSQDTNRVLIMYTKPGEIVTVDRQYNLIEKLQSISTIENGTVKVQQEIHIMNIEQLHTIER